MDIRLLIEENPDYKPPEIRLRCARMDDNLRKIVEYIRVRSDTIAVKTDGAARVLPLATVFYFESVDRKAFAYCASNVYECGESLAVLEKKLAESTFVRISKSCIVNTMSIKSVKPLDNHRLKALLRNGEAQIINRHYVTALKDKLGL